MRFDSSFLTSRLRIHLTWPRRSPARANRRRCHSTSDDCLNWTPCSPRWLVTSKSTTKFYVPPNDCRCMPVPHNWFGGPIPIAYYSPACRPFSAKLCLPLASCNGMAKQKMSACDSLASWERPHRNLTAAHAICFFPYRNLELGRPRNYAS